MLGGAMGCSGCSGGSSLLCLRGVWSLLGLPEDLDKRGSQRMWRSRVLVSSGDASRPKS